MLSLTELEHLEVLSRIRIDNMKRDEYLKKLEHVIAYIGHLAKVNTQGVKPTSQVTNLENVLREDVVEESLPQSEALRNSKHVLNGYFKLPKVVD